MKQAGQASRPFKQLSVPGKGPMFLIPEFFLVLLLFTPLMFIIWATCFVRLLNITGIILIYLHKPVKLLRPFLYPSLQSFSYHFKHVCRLWQAVYNKLLKTIKL